MRLAKLNASYRTVIVESYKPLATSGLHGDLHIRPVKGQGLAETLHVECSKKLSRNYPVGTKFKIQARLTDRDSGGEYLYSYHGWAFEIMK
jgi:hypothetical protein